MERTIQFEAPTLIILAHGHLVLLVQPPRTKNTKIYTKHQKHFTPSKAHRYVHLQIQIRIFMSSSIILIRETIRIHHNSEFECIFFVELSFATICLFEPNNRNMICQGTKIRLPNFYHPLHSCQCSDPQCSGLKILWLV